MRRRPMLFTDPITKQHFVLKYSAKAKDYVRVFEGSYNECVSFMMSK